MFSQTFHVTIILLKQDSKALSPRPLENAPETFNAKIILKFLMLINSWFLKRPQKFTKSSPSIKHLQHLCQIKGADFVIFCCLLRKHKL